MLLYILMQDMSLAIVFC